MRFLALGYLTGIAAAFHYADGFWSGILIYGLVGAAATLATAGLWLVVEQALLLLRSVARPREAEHGHRAPVRLRASDR